MFYFKSKAKHSEEKLRTLSVDGNKYVTTAMHIRQKVVCIYKQTQRMCGCLYISGASLYKAVVHANFSQMKVLLDAELPITGLKQQSIKDTE
jgi:hypothetical protein